MEYLVAALAAGLLAGYIAGRRGLEGLGRLFDAAMTSSVYALVALIGYWAVEEIDSGMLGEYFWFGAATLAVPVVASFLVAYVAWRLGLLCR